MTLSAVTRRRLATAGAIIALATEGASLLILIANTAALTLAQLGFNGIGGIILGGTYPVIGWLIALRQPHNRIGWIFLVVGLSQAGTGFFSQYAAYGLVTQPGSLPGADLASWVGAWSWVPGFTGLFLMLLLFPDGGLPSRRWRLILGLGLASGGTIMIGSAVESWGIRGLALIMGGSPDTTSDPALGFVMTWVNIGMIMLSLVGLAAIVSLAVRFRRAEAVERQQIKWFAAAGAIEVALILLTIVITLPYPFDILAAIVAAPLVPIATVVAILRYRLYDIDRIISRTVSYGAVTGILAVVFVGTILVSQTVLSSFFRGNSVAVAASTLVVAALFQPLRRRVQSVVDRRFNRSRYDAERTVAAFGERLRDQVDLASLSGDIADVVDSTLHPSRIGVWLRAPGRDVSHSTTP